MTEMIEKVAKAIYTEWARDAAKAENWEELVQYGHTFVDLARREARAAVEAIREPNAEMYRAAFDALVPSSDARACWEAMIDAALNGKEG